MAYRRERIRCRNEEIRRVFRHLRKVERRESSYCLELLEQNYHLKPLRIYQILAEDEDPEAIDNPSIFYLNTVPNEHQIPG